MNSERRMTVRRSLVRLALLASASAAAVSCNDQSPTSVSPSLQAAKVTSSGGSSKIGLIVCSQTYDSVTKVIGPRGDTLQVGNHILWIDSLVLSVPVAITAVAPADTVRWVRFRPEGLVFPPSAVDLSYGLDRKSVV